MLPPTSTRPPAVWNGLEVRDALSLSRPRHVAGLAPAEQMACVGRRMGSLRAASWRSPGQQYAQADFGLRRRFSRRAVAAIRSFSRSAGGLRRLRRSSSAASGSTATHHPSSSRAITCRPPRGPGDWRARGGRLLAPQSAAAHGLAVVRRWPCALMRPLPRAVRAPCPDRAADRRLRRAGDHRVESLGLQQAGDGALLPLP